jgi:hypothetical protein
VEACPGHWTPDGEWREGKLHAADAIPEKSGGQAILPVPLMMDRQDCLSSTYAAGCANPVITYDPDFTSFFSRMMLLLCASSSRSLKVL